MVKRVFLLSLYLLSQASWANVVTLSGDLVIDPKCGESKAVVWLSQDSELLLHVNVPHQGSFGFSLKPGTYELAISTSQNCELKQTIEIQSGQSRRLKLEVVP